MRGSVLFIHAFADEMNKSRRMAALQARSLAAAGFETLQIDLFGCGDSDGEFGEATWERWIGDVKVAADWLVSRSPMQLWIWGMRAGCLLATSAASELKSRANFVFWQPPASGKSVLQQFLRLRVASSMTGTDRSSVRMSDLRHQLDAGVPLEVAGYVLAPGLAKGLEQSTLSPPPWEAEAIFIEVGPQEEAEMSVATTVSAKCWEEAGSKVHLSAVQGPAFWQTAEIEDAPALVDRTTTTMLGWNKRQISSR